MHTLTYMDGNSKKHYSTTRMAQNVADSKVATGYSQRWPLKSLSLLVASLEKFPPCASVPWVALCSE